MTVGLKGRSLEYVASKEILGTMVKYTGESCKNHTSLCVMRRIACNKNEALAFGKHGILLWPDVLITGEVASGEDHTTVILIGAGCG